MALATIMFSPAYLAHRDKIEQFNGIINDFNMKQGYSKYGLATLGTFFSRDKTTFKTKDIHWHEGLIFKNKFKIAQLIRRFHLGNSHAPPDLCVAQHEDQIVELEEVTVTFDNTDVKEKHEE